MKIVQTNIVSSTPADVNVNISGHRAISVCAVTEQSWISVFVGFVAAECETVALSPSPSGSAVTTASVPVRAADWPQAPGDGASSV